MDLANPANLRALAAIPWLVFGLVWLVSAGFTKTAVQREPLAVSVRYRVPLVIACVLMYWPGLRHTMPMLAWPVLPLGTTGRLVGVAMSAAGVAFAIWARLHLGKMWSSAITLKQDHQLIQSGPYKLARHPIYTGMLFAFAGTAVTIDTLQALIAVPLFVVAFVSKLSHEERLMAATFGAAHTAYRARVKRLIPFVW